SLVKQALTHEGTPEKFWQDLRQDARFQGGVADDIAFALQTALLTRDNVPLVRVLHGLRKKGTVRTSRDLVKLSAADWQAMVTSAGNGKGPAIPPAIPGETEQERTKSYVHLVTETLKEAFPTACMALGMAQEPALDKA